MTDIVQLAGDASPDDASIDNLYPAVIECFAIILLGYLAGRSGLIGLSETKGLNSFIGMFSLPSLIFLSMAQLDFSKVNWTFLLAISLAKSVVFFSVLLISLLVTRPLKLDKAGLFAIFATQSNDFALGYPIIAALYHKSHPDYASYLYLVAPVNLIILNPIAFILMEISKQKNLQNEELLQSAGGNNPLTISAGGSRTSAASSYSASSPAKSHGRAGTPVGMRILNRVIRGVLLNPVILMTTLGIIANLIFDHCLPEIPKEILKILGSAFSACALFSLGLTMVGSAATLKGSGFVVPGILIGIKLLVMPVVTREFVSLLQAGSTVNETVSLSNFGFLYGTFPTAPGVFVYATSYDIAVQLIASSMVACTFISAPLMFVSAKMITLTKLDNKDYVMDLDNFIFNMSIIGLISTIWVIVVFILSRKWKKVPHCITLCLVISQALACTGGILWSWIGVEKGVSWRLYLQFGVLSFGVLSSRIWTSILAVSLVFLRCRSLCFVLRLRPFMGVIGYGIPACLIIVLCTAVSSETLCEKLDPNFQYGQTQALVALLILLISFIITIGSLVMQQRYERQYSQYQTVNQSSTGLNDEESLISTGVGLSDNDPNENDIEGQHHRHHHKSDGTIVTKRRDSFTFRNRCNSCNGCSSVDKIKEKAIKTSCNNNNEGLKEIEDLGVCGEMRGVGCEDSDDEDGASDIFSYNDNLCSPRKHPCDSSQRRRCAYLLERYRTNQLTEPEEVCIVRDRDDEFQMLRHIVLLLLLCFSMFVGIALCMWTLIVEEKSGIYVELVFLDAALNFGQGFFTFMLFGLNTKLIVMPLQKCFRRLMYGEGSVYLPKWEELSSETKQICEQFLTYHIDKCVQDIVRDRTWRMEDYKEVFFGQELVDWLLLVGLAKDRSEAVRYGRHLISGRVIRHIKNVHNFHDQSIFYSFSPS